MWLRLVGSGTVCLPVPPPQPHSCFPRPLSAILHRSTRCPRTFRPFPMTWLPLRTTHLFLLPPSLPEHHWTLTELHHICLCRLGLLSVFLLPCHDRDWSPAHLLIYSLQNQMQKSKVKVRISSIWLWRFINVHWHWLGLDIGGVGGNKM